MRRMRAKQPHGNWKHERMKDTVKSGEPANEAFNNWTDQNQLLSMPEEDGVWLHDEHKNSLPVISSELTFRWERAQTRTSGVLPR